MSCLRGPLSGFSMCLSFAFPPGSWVPLLPQSPRLHLGKKDDSGLLCEHVGSFHDRN